MDINTLDPSVLTERQKTVAHDIVRSGRETCDILKEHGVCEDEFTEWVTDGIFPLYVSHLAVAFAGAEEPFVWAKLLTLIRNDNLQAIKLYFTLRDKKIGTVTSAELPDSAICELRDDIFGEEG